ncbi:MAG: outer rane autotransporter barrel domain protein [Moraxellaceae bacterium]|jgi:hypothetical protein|nr:outer rane autotransporter barrel domain protein [Moraxellaceae bacterium]
MRNNVKPAFRLSVLSYAVALAAGSMAQSAVALDLCVGQSSVTISTLATEDTCTLDVTNASLTVTATGALENGAAGAADNVAVTNDGHISQYTYGSSADAAALYMDRTASSAISNTGTLSADAEASSYSATETSSAYARGYAAGIHVDGDMAASLSNSGEIVAETDADANGDDAYADATAAGVNIAGSVTSAGAVRNDGFIGAFAHADASGWYDSAAHADATGVNIDGDASLLTNSGTIFADASAWVDNNYSPPPPTTSTPTTGYINSAQGMSGSLVNNGDIRVGATATAVRVGGDIAAFINDDDIGARADGDYAEATGLDFGYAGSLKNRGNIAVEAEGEEADAVAIYVGEADSLVNRGNLGARAAGDYADATGINAEYVGVLENRGTLKADAWMWGDDDYYSEESFHASAQGISLGWADTLVNSGTIEAGAWQSGGWYGDVNADGLSFGGISVLTNSGAILAQAGGDDARANGITGEGVESLANIGSIHASAQGDDDVYANGVSLYFSGLLDSSGTISAEAYGDEHAAASGISVYVADIVTNSGTVTADASSYGDYSEDYAYASAYGMRVGSVGDRLSNTGVISASASSDGYGEVDAVALSVGGSEPSMIPFALNDAAPVDMHAVIENSGLLSARAYSDEGYAHAAGLQLGGEMLGLGVSLMPSGASGLDVSNTGTITADAATDDGAAFAAGVAMDWLGDSSVTNAAGGSIAASAEGYEHAAASGMAAYVLSGSLLQNDGTISASALSLSHSSYENVANAAGVRIDEAMLASQIVNNGRITADASGRVGAEAYGIDAGYVGEGSEILNTGIITAQAGDEMSYASAYGIAADEVDGASISNTGTITAEVISGDDSDADAYAYGISLQSLDYNDHFTGIMPIGVLEETASGRLTNSGTITATASSENEDAEATGIEVDYMGGNAELINERVINAVATSASESAEAYGIHLDGEMVDGALISNGGTITVQATAGGSSADAYGMRAGSLYGSSSMMNKGTISVVARASGASSDESSADAYGMRASYLTDTASVSNSGAISVLAEGVGDTSAQAYGMRASTLSGESTLRNSGTVMARAMHSSTDGEGSAEAFGLYASDVDDGAVISNSGTIVAAAASDGVASAYGIYVSEALDDDARVENTGTIFANGNAKGQSYAVYAERGDGLVINSGTMQAGVYLGAGNDHENYTGNLFVNDYSGQGISLVNSGSITHLIGSPSYVGGDYTQQAGGSMTFVVRDVDHYGKIDVAGTADFAASNKLHVQVDPVHLLVDGDVLYNVIASDDLVASAFNVTDNSVFWNFDAAIDGSYVDLVTRYVDARNAVFGTGLNLSPSLASLVDGVIADGETGRYATLAAALNGASTAAAAADVIEHMAPVLTAGAAQATRVAGEGVSSAIGARIVETRGAASGDAFKDAAVWVKPFVGKAEQDAANGVSGYDANTDGVVIGVDGAVSDAWRVGAALATAKSDVEGRISDVDVDSAQATVYGSYAIDNRTALDLHIGAAQHSYDGSRLNIDNSRSLSSFDGLQLSFGAILSRSYKLGEKSALVPSLALQYNQVALDAYTETGASIYNLSVQDADEESILVAARGSYELTLGKGVFSANLGIAHDSVDAATATSTLSGNGPTFVTNGIEPDAMVFTGGIGYRYVTSKNLEINAVYDLESRDGFQGQTASIKFKLPF